MRVAAAAAADARAACVSTMCPRIDDALRGGVRARHVTEIAGESASAKTTLCAQLAVRATARGGAAVYVHTDGPAPTALMRRIATSARFVAEACDGDEDAALAALERVYVVKALGDADALRETLTAVSAVLRAPVSEDAVVRMIVVDSIAAPFRDDATNGGWTYAAKRAGALHKLTMLLKEYATKHDVAVVVTNHVVDSVRENGTGAHGDGAVATRAMGEFTTSGRRVVPALGLMWSNCVNARLFLTRRATRGQGYVVGGDDGDDGNAGVARTLHVVYAPHLPESSVDFVVREDGAWDVAAPRPRAVA